MFALSHCRAALVIASCWSLLGSSEASAQTQASRELRVVARLSGLPLGGRDTLFMDEPGVELAMAGRVVGLLVPERGNIALYDLGTGSVLILGRAGDGPGDVPKNARALAISTAGVLAFATTIGRASMVYAMDFDGNELWRKRLDRPLVPFEQPVQMDGRGNVFVATEQLASDRRRTAKQPDSLHVVIHRFSRDGGDSAATAPLRTARPLVFRNDRGGVGEVLLTSLYTYGGDVGRLLWQVDSTGRIYISRSDRIGIDTMRIGGGRGVLVPERAVNGADVPDEIISAELNRFRASTPERVRALQPARTARTIRLSSNGRELWMQRPAFAPDGTFDPARSRVDVYDLAGRLRYTISPPFAMAIGPADYVTRGYDRATETSLLEILQANAPTPPVVPPRVARRSSR